MLIMFLLVNKCQGFQLIELSSFQSKPNGSYKAQDHFDTSLSKIDGKQPTAIGHTSLPPLLQEMVDERREFEMNLGRAMDTLRRDYPRLLKEVPGKIFQIAKVLINLFNKYLTMPWVPDADYTIFHDEILVVDPSGVQLSGLNHYKSSFRFLKTTIGFIYSLEKSTIQYRMIYDFARQSIRISFNVMLLPKVVGNRNNALYIDGISVYKMESKSGKIIEHRVENLLMNNIPMRPPYGILTELLRPIPSLYDIPVGVPAG